MSSGQQALPCSFPPRAWKPELKKKKKCTFPPPAWWSCVTPSLGVISGAFAAAIGLCWWENAIFCAFLLSFPWKGHPGFPKAQHCGFQALQVEVSLPSDHKKNQIYVDLPRVLWCRLMGAWQKELFGVNFDFVGRASPLGAAGSARKGLWLFFFPPSFLRVLLVQRVGWGAGMSSQGTWSIPQEYLASSLLQANPPSSFPSQHKLGWVLSWFWSWFPFQTSSWAQSHQGVCQLELFPDRLGPGTGKSFCLEPLAQHQQSPFCEFWACSGEELQRFG